MRVRRAERADLERVHAIAAANPMAPQWTVSQFAEILSPEDGSAVARVLLVAEDGDEVVGFAVVSALTTVYPMEAELESIAVDPGRKRQGVARMLMNAVLDWTREAGAADLRLEVRQGNAPALGLYAKYDFHNSGVRRGYYASPTEDAVCMIRKIDSALR